MGRSLQQKEWGFPLQGQFCSSQHSLWGAREGSREALSQGIGQGCTDTEPGQQPLGACPLLLHSVLQCTLEAGNGQGSPQNHIGCSNGPRALGWKLGQEDELVWMMQK